MNAKNELLDILKEIKGTIKCAIINGTCYRNVSLNKLKCNHTQIEFELFINNEKQDKFYFTSVDSNYGNANGVFTKNNLLFWICPPFIIE